MNTVVIFVPGIKTEVKYLSFWKSYLAKTFPTTETIFVEGRYHYSEHEKLIEKRDYLIKVIQNLDAEQKVVLITHSYGSIIAKSALDSLEDTARITYISMAGPHDPSLEDITESKEILGYEYGKPEYQTYTYGGYFDTTVRPNASQLPHTKHLNVFVGHTWFIIPKIPMLSRIKKDLNILVSGK